MTGCDSQSRSFAITDQQSAIIKAVHREGNPDEAYIYVELENKNLDIQRLEYSWNQLIVKHATLRSVIREDKMQVVYGKTPAYKIISHDLRTFRGNLLDKKFIQIRKSILQTTYALNEWPLFTINISRLPGDRVRLHICIHPVICDLAGFKTLLQEWASAYQDMGNTGTDLNSPSIDNPFDTSEKVTPKANVSAEVYWENKIKDLPDKPHLPEKDNAQYKPGYVTVSRRIPGNLFESLEQKGLKKALPVSNVLMYAFTETLANWSKNQHFCLNTHISRRSRFNNNIPHDTPGEFSTYVPIGTFVCNKTPFYIGAQKLMEEYNRSLDHLGPKGHEIIDKISALKGEPVEGVLPVVFNDMMESKRTRKVHFTGLFGRFAYCEYHMPDSLLNHTVFEEQDDVLLCWHFNPGFYDKAVIETMFDAYINRLIRLGSGEGAWQQCYPRLTPEDKLKKRKAVNNTRVEYQPELLQEPFFRMAEKFPDNPAIISGDGQMSYRVLKTRTLQVSNHIESTISGKTGDVVAVIIDKCPEQVIAVLATLRAGCAYLPISPDWPKARIWYLLKDAGVSLVLTLRKTGEQMELPAHVKTIFVDEERSHRGKTSATFLKKKQEVSSLAYIIYTSGSSGNPKGVMISHLGAFNTVYDINRRFRVNENDRILALSELSFDLSVYDIFGALSAGAAIVMPRNKSKMFPLHWYNLVKNQKVTIWNSVPAFMVLFMEVLEKCLDGVDLRLVMLSGDWIPVSLPARIKKLIPETQVVSLGGATEASIWSIFYPVGETDPAWRSIPYGKPLGNQSFHVLNDHLEPCPDLVTGKLYIGGRGIAMGYLNNKELSDASFILHPGTGEYLYSTGDLGRYLPDGNIEFLGREDFQVKISGFRIELQEIESVLNQYPGVKFSVVKPCGPARDKKKLVAWIVKQDPQEEICPTSIRQFLKSMLPDYMVPVSYMFLDKLPLSANGKIDRKSLPSIDLI